MLEEPQSGTKTTHKRIVGADDPLSEWNRSAERSVRAAASAIDERTGIVKQLTVFPGEPGEPQVYHAECLVTNWQHEEHNRNTSTTGAGLTENLAVACGIGEALERYCAANYDSKVFIVANYDQLRRSSLDAVAPHVFALYSDRQYASEGFVHRRFTDDLVLSWTCGLSMTSGREVWVPASFVYCPYHHDGLATLTFETTTGLCCADSLDAAILGGACEAIERDASMCVWMNRLACHRLSPESGSWVSAALHDRFSSCGCDLQLFDMTLDIQIPSVLAMLIDPAHDGAAVAVGTATRPTIEMAVSKAALEAAQVRRWLKRIAQFNVRANYRSDFADVCEFADHVRLFGIRDSLRYVDFLLSSPTRSRPVWPHPEEERSLRSQLQRCLAQLAACGLDPVVIDLTRPEVRRLGFHVVKVLIPGLTDLNADHNYPRLGGARLYSARISGDREERCAAELNPVPHPFP